MPKARFLLASALVCCTCVGAADLKLPAPHVTPPVENAPKLIPKPENRTLQVPAGLAVEPFASGFKKPRLMLELPTGAVLVADTVAKGSVYALVKDQPNKEVISGL